MSTTRFDNPEVSSESLKVNVALGLGSRTNLAIEDTSYHTDGTEVYGFVRGNITAAKGLAISVKTDDDSATHIGLKYQFYGANTEQSSKGNISQAFTLGYERNTTNAHYYTSGNYSKCHNFYCDYVSNAADWEHDTDVYDIAWVVGYKLAERSIIYGGPFYQWGQINGYKKIANIAEEKLNGNGYMIGANIAIEHRFSFGMGLAGEIVYSNLDWGQYSQSDTAFNFKIDYQF